MSTKQRLVLQLYAEKVVSRTVCTEVNKIARCLVGAEVFKSCLCSKINQPEVLLEAMKYLACWEGGTFETTLLNLCQQKPEHIEAILKLHPAKTLEVGYL